MYAVKLAFSGFVAATALAQDSVEGVVASMLVSPLGPPMIGLAPAVLEGDVFAAAALAATIVASALALVGIGAASREAFGGHGPPTGEMKKRAGVVDVRGPIAFATAVWALMAIASSRTGDDDAVGRVGLAIAISVTPPLVNAGMLWVDRVRGVAGVDGAVRNGVDLASCNVVGVILGGALAWCGTNVGAYARV